MKNYTYKREDHAQSVFNDKEIDQKDASYVVHTATPGKAPEVGTGQSESREQDYDRAVQASTTVRPSGVERWKQDSDGANLQTISLKNFTEV